MSQRHRQRYVTCWRPVERHGVRRIVAFRYCIRTGNRYCCSVFRTRRIIRTRLIQDGRGDTACANDQVLITTTGGAGDAR
ncbi:hypothetical protein, partial [Sedimenticola selenatireducens]|uniref:hypothetical protein n=1 Tax=Sedimenticola selenatireducens TaxID=191960 RepID=UPI001C907BDF